MTKTHLAALQRGFALVHAPAPALGLGLANSPPERHERHLAIAQLIYRLIVREDAERAEHPPDEVQVVEPRGQDILGGRVRERERVVEDWEQRPQGLRVEHRQGQVGLGHDARRKGTKVSKESWKSNSTKRSCADSGLGFNRKSVRPILSSGHESSNVICIRTSYTDEIWTII